ncbi:MAG: hypothetical protein V4514_10145 [Pseudomonadota bacterium]|uniref:maleate cis-trans isomerase family protein n=1 Tax=Phenylobacterium sp. TaxID=1871053 RepID=UPI0025E495CE|nr:hypothetical protein [Phenylobacterium sp.]MBT9470531.1 hypothetical protein [Phenylobacterium sp.]
MAGYGSLGRYGVGTPQANPTVEVEFTTLLPRAAALYTTRLTSPVVDSLGRLEDYLVRLDDYLASYDLLQLDAFGFACTGASYLVGRERELEIIEACSAARGYPVITAADAIVWALEKLGARRVAVLAPYPDTLVQAGKVYFENRGLTICAHARVETRTTDTRSIYELGWETAQAKLAQFDLGDADVILLSGTGMPTLPLVDTMARRPVISSNLCLAARMLDAAGRGEALLEAVLEPKGFRARLNETLGLGAAA